MEEYTFCFAHKNVKRRNLVVYDLGVIITTNTGCDKCTNFLIVCSAGRKYPLCKGGGQIVAEGDIIAPQAICFYVNNSFIQQGISI